MPRTFYWIDYWLSEFPYSLKSFYFPKFLEVLPLGMVIKLIVAQVDDPQDDE